MTLPSWLDRTAYPFTPRSLELPQGRVSYLDEGDPDADPILFVHGTPTWSFDWRHLIRALSPRHRCIAIDLLGFGLSDRPRDFAYTPEAHAEVLAAFVARLGLLRYTLVAHDFGGPIALPLALGRPEHVQRLVLMNTWMWSFEDDASMLRKARVAGSGFGRWLYRRANFSLRVLTPSAYGDRKKLTPAIHGQLLAPFPDADARGRVLHTLARSLIGSSAHYADLWHRRARLAGIPSLIVWGLRDSAFPPYQLRRLREAVPHARVLELGNAGHWPHEEAPDEVTRALTAFLAEPPARVSADLSADLRPSHGAAARPGHQGLRET